MKVKVEVWGEVKGKHMIIGECLHNIENIETETPYINIPIGTSKIKIAAKTENKKEKGYRCVIERFYWEACKKCAIKDCAIKEELKFFFEH